MTTVCYAAGPNPGLVTQLGVASVISYIIVTIPKVISTVWTIHIRHAIACAADAVVAVPAENDNTTAIVVADRSTVVRYRHLELLYRTLEQLHRVTRRIVKVPEGEVVVFHNLMGARSIGGHQDIIHGHIPGSAVVHHPNGGVAVRVRVRVIRGRVYEVVPTPSMGDVMTSTAVPYMQIISLVVDGFTVIPNRMISLNRSPVSPYTWKGDCNANVVSLSMRG